MITEQTLINEISQMLKLETLNKIEVFNNKIKFFLSNKKIITITAIKIIK